MTEYELRYMEDEVLVAAAKERDRLLKLHTALRHAANHGHLEAAEELMTAEGIDVNNKDGSGWSALAWACKMGRLDVARYLLSVGADIDSTDKVSAARCIYAIPGQYVSCYCLIFQVFFFLLLIEPGRAIDVGLSKESS